MADVPRDPRQLARDILSGKISIEDLAREQALARGRVGMPGVPPLQQRPPAQPPVVRQVFPMPAQRPMQRAPAPFPQRRPIPVPRPPQQARPVQQQRRLPSLQVTVQPSSVVTRPPAALAPTQAQVAAQDTAASAARAATRKATAQARVRQMLRSRSTIREGILIAEILGTPVSMRDT